MKRRVAAIISLICIICLTGCSVSQNDEEKNNTPTDTIVQQNAGGENADTGDNTDKSDAGSPTESVDIVSDEKTTVEDKKAEVRDDGLSEVNISYGTAKDDSTDNSEDNPIDDTMDNPVDDAVDNLSDNNTDSNHLDEHDTSILVDPKREERVWLTLGSGGSKDFEGEVAGEIISLIKNLKLIGNQETVLWTSHSDWNVQYPDSSQIEYPKYIRAYSTDGWKIVDNYYNCYEDSPELTEKIFEALALANNAGLRSNAGTLADNSDSTTAPISATGNNTEDLDDSKKEPLEYRNFYEFARRPDMDEAIEEYYVDYYPAYFVVSKNLTQTDEGVPISINIYSSGRPEMSDVVDGKLTDIWDYNSSMNGEVQYSTGLYFTDNGVGHMPDTLPIDFKLTFDNYNGDANPDFCVRYMDDEDGTYYCLKEVWSNGIVANLSGRAFEGGIYIAGCTDPSPRLQRTESVNYIGWKKEDGVYYPTTPGGSKITLPDVNMYPDRMGLPNGLDTYAEDEDTVTCFIWNNTDKEIKTGGDYCIEMLERGQWKMITKGIEIESRTIEPREYAEVAYDISSIKDRKHAKYRITQRCGSYTAYAEFICQGEELTDFDAEAFSIIPGVHFVRLKVENVSLGTSNITSAVLKTENGDIQLGILSGFVDSYVLYSEDMPVKPGEYTIILNGKVPVKFEISEKNLDYKLEISGEKQEDGIVITLKTDRDATLINGTIIKQPEDGKPTMSYLVLDEGTDDIASLYAEGIENNGNGNSGEKNEYLIRGTTLKAGVEYKLRFVDYMKEFFTEDTIDELYKMIQEADESDLEDFEMIGIKITRDTTREEIAKRLKDLMLYNPEAKYTTSIKLDYQGYGDIMICHKF